MNQAVAPGRTGILNVAGEVRLRLEAIEREHGVRVIFSCESGSRAWGFASTDSDYDVRFIYARPRDWYFSVDVEDRRDVIEMPIDSVWDIAGWDLRKALRLLRKSNPPLLEWLQSPLVYLERTSGPNDMRAVLGEHFSPQASLHHYLHMAQGNFREFLRGDEVWVKKYFYVLRPLLACRWIEQGLGPAPIEFVRLVERTVHEVDVSQAIAELIAQKRAGAELDRGPRVPALSGFIEKELARPRREDLPRRKASATERLNEIFRKAVDEAWESVSGP
jgi:uncharacterized protein